MSVAESMRRGIAGSRLVVFEGAGHIVNVECPQRFNDEMRAFLG